MAYIRTYYKGQPDKGKEICQFQVPKVADVSTLPTETTSVNKCAIGSTCIVEATWDIYILCSDNKWKVM